MAYTFYNYVGLIKPDSKVDIPRLAEQLKLFYSDSKGRVIVTENVDGILVIIDQYTFEIVIQDNQDVLAESKEMANDFKQDYAGNPIIREDIENCSRRFEIAGQEDYDMDYFNDSLYILECIEKFDGVTILSLN